MKKFHKYWTISGAGLALAILYYFSLPPTLFPDDYATVLNDRNDELLGAAIASDGQWRFPPVDSPPEKYKIALLQFEDRYFFRHPGFNPVSIARAAYQNMKAGKIVGGGSTLTMQVIRLARKDKPRTYLEKIIEAILATRLELRYAKDEILNLYASHAPFGGNIVGLNAASWRYFGRKPDQLSWGEAALLAVLPNSPALIHPGRNRDALLKKRNRLIDKLLNQGILDSLTAELAKSEAIPEQPEKLPDGSWHLLARSIKEGYQNKIIQSTLDKTVQEQVAGAVNRHHHKLKFNGIHNAAALVAEVSTGNILAYVGNVKIDGTDDKGDFVDVIMAKRSTGSILKPFLYAAMQDEGFILPNTLIPDIPTIMDGFAPKNFAETFDGAVPASRALARSLNVPAVHMLKDYSYEKFYDKLKQFGISTINEPPSHYGLSLILGGAEASLWELTGAYASMARTLANYFKYPEPERYNKNDIHPLYYLKQKDNNSESIMSESGIVNAGALWHTFNAMLDVNRPDEESSWRLYSSSQMIAWKTGTSYGFRDAWAIGVTPQYVVGVWAGNADGEGRPGLTGVEAAAPLLFEIFNLLPRQSAWFSKPYSNLIQKRVCRMSGYIASEICESVDTLWICEKGAASGVCPYHRIVYLDRTGKYRVDSDCESVAGMVAKPWFVLPPAMEWYFKSKNAGYRSLPPAKIDCEGTKSKVASMQLIYPKQFSRIFVPRELDGSMGRAVFELAHRSPSMEVFWHLDNTYLGSTKRIHQMAVHPDEGRHTLTCVDQSGESVSISFEIIGKAN